LAFGQKRTGVARPKTGSRFTLQAVGLRSSVVGQKLTGVPRRPPKIVSRFTFKNRDWRLAIGRKTISGHPPPARALSRLGHGFVVRSPPPGRPMSLAFEIRSVSDRQQIVVLSASEGPVLNAVKEPAVFVRAPEKSGFFAGAQNDNFE
jgi:hypothetical protein